MATQNMRRLKFAKFFITKNYTNKTIEELVEDKRIIRQKEKYEQQKVEKKEFEKQMLEK